MPVYILIKQMTIIQKHPEEMNQIILYKVLNNLKLNQDS